MKKRQLLTILIWFLFPLLLTCSTVSKLVISDSDEEELGAEFHRQLLENKAEYPLFEPGADNGRQTFKNYLDSVFITVLQSVPGDDLPNYKKEFEFTIIDKDVVNAFAVPGGYIYIYTGLIKVMENESELAGVLGHEIAHVIRHHYRQYATKAALVSTIIEAIVGGETALAEFVKGAFNVLSGTYISRDHEYEADEYGTKYLAYSGRNPRGISMFFSRQDAGWHPEVISTHPAPEKRVEAVEKLVAESGWEDLDKEELKFKARFDYNTGLAGF